MLAATNPASAQTPFFAAKGPQSNGFERDATVASVGKFGGSNFVTTGYVIFSVQDILANESLTIGDLATTGFKLDFDTIISDVDLANTGTGFVVDYLGFFPNVTDLSRDAFWNGSGKLNQKAAVQTVTPGVFDEAGFGQSITASSFTLSGVTEADSADDYVAFKYSYNVADFSADIPSNTVQYLGNHTLTVSILRFFAAQNPNPIISEFYQI